MKIKLNYARQLWLSLLLLVGVAAIAVPGLNGTNEDSPVAMINETGIKYLTLQEAVAAAKDGATIQVIKAGEYAIPAITKNLKIEATVEGVAVKHEDNSAITTIASGKTATFKNITFNLGTLKLPTAHGFGTENGSNGSLAMDGCTINGALNLFGASTFTNCKFDAEGIYNIWAVNDDATFTDCTFTNTNRAVNVYDQKKSSTKKNVSFSGCTFNGSEKRKAAVNIHHNPDPVGTAAKYAVSITNCTTSGTWASTVGETGEPDEKTICNSTLWMISDIVNWEDGDISVTVNGVAQDVSKFSPVAKIGDTKYTSLQAAVAAAEDGATIQVIKAGEYAIPAITKNLTIEGAVDGVAVKHEDNSAITTIASGKTATFKNITFNLGTLQLPTAHGFGTLSGSNGALVMDGCTINGALNLFGESTFTDCKFNAEGIYNIWAVNDNATFTGCTFTNTNRAVNVYDQKKSSTAKNVSFSNCTFEGSAKKKAAVNIHHNPDPVGTAAKYAVSITNCNTSGTWASTVGETGEPDGSTICYSPLWMISDIVNWEDGDITVKVDGVAQDVSKFSPVAKIGETKYTSLEAAVNAAAEGDEILILKDFTLTTVTTSPNNKYNVNVNKSVTINGDGHTITSSEGKRALALTGDGNNITLKNLTVVNNKSDWCVGILNNPTVTLDATTIDGTGYQGGYNQPLTIGGSGAGGVKLNVTNGSVIKTNDEGTAHYSIIAWRPADITVTNSKLIGWAGVYLKPDAAGSTVKIDGSEMKSTGIKGNSNNFAAIVTESGNNEIEVKDTKISTTPAENTNQSLFVLGGEGNVVTFLGTSTYETTNMTYGAVTYSPGSLFNNKVYFDDATKEAFAKYFTAENGPSISDEKESPINLYPLTYSPEVYYYWFADGKEAGGYYNLADPFNNGWLDNEEFIRLMKDVDLKANLAWAKENASFTMTFGDFKVTKGEYSIALKQGVTVNTDKQTDIFSAVDASYKVVETAVEGGYTYTVVTKEYVAKIGEEQYYSLAEAFEAATDGQTITVLTDIDLPSTIAVTKQVILDLDGKTISNTSDLWGGDNWSFFSVQANGNLTVTGNGTIDAKENDCYTFDVRDGGNLTIKNGTFTGNISCVYLLNQAGTGVSTCNIEGGTFSIKQLADVPSDKYRYLLNCLDVSYASNTVKFNVTGGSYVNFNPANNQAEGVETNFCAAGYEAVQNGDVWTVQKAPVAKIGETTYTSLAEAFEAAQDGQTITVLTDIDLPSTIAVTKQVTLDLDGKTISNTSDLWGGDNWSFFSVRANGNLTVTGNGTIDAKENDCYTFDVRDGGNLTIKNGTFTGNISSVYLINEAGTGVSTCNIEGGTFSIKQLADVPSDKYRYLLNCHDASYKNNTAKFNVTGGSFVNFNPANNLAEGEETNFCAAGYEAVQNGDVWTVQRAAVAKIGEMVYYSLADAVEAVPTDGTETTITLLADVSETLIVSKGKNIVLDLGGKTVTGGTGIGKGYLTIKNGTLAGQVDIYGSAAEVDNYNGITVDATATITSTYGIILREASGSKAAYGTTIDINGTVNGMVWVMGNITEGNSVINVNSGAYIKGDVGVALNGLATVNVKDGATIEGSELGIEVRAGNLNVEGGNISSTATEYTVNSNGNGSAATGAAISVAQHTTHLPTNANITGGTLNGLKTISVSDPEKNNLKDVTVKVADALVNAETVVIPEGYEWVSDGAMSTLTPRDPVAKIDETVYYSLADAVAAVPTDGTEKTITLLANVSENVAVRGGKNIVLDLGEKTLTGMIDQYDSQLTVKNGNVAGTVYVNGGPASEEAGYNKFTLAEDATINANWGFILYQGPNGNDAYGSVIDINGTVNGTAWVMGNITEGNSVINVNSGATIEGSVFGLNGLATLNVKEGATIIGSETGIEVRAGNLNVEGGTITSTAAAYNVKPNGSGTTTDGAAIAISQHTTGLPINANILGGTLTGIKTISVADPEGGNFAGVVVTAKDELTEKENNVIPDGYIWVSNNDGTSTLKTKEDAGVFELKDWEVYPYLSYTEDKEAASVTYIRRFGNTNWQALFIPFDINDISELTDRYEFAKIHMVTLQNENHWTNGDKIEVYYTKITSGKIYANKPYLIKPKKTGEQSIVVENTTLRDTHGIEPMTTSTMAANYIFTGTYVGETATSQNTFFAMGSGTINYCDNVDLGAYRWYIKPDPKGDNYAKPIIDFIESDSDATGISSVMTGDDSDIEGYYNINGVRSETPVRGINIIRYKNGSTRKVVIK